MIDTMHMYVVTSIQVYTFVLAMQARGDPSVNIVNRCQLHIPVGFSRLVAYLYVGVHLMHVLVVVISLTVRLEMFM